MSGHGLPWWEDPTRLSGKDPPGLGISPEKEMATHSSILTWKIPWTEEPGRLQSTGLQRAGHSLEAKQQQQASTGCKGYGQKWSCGPDGLSESHVQRSWA